LFAFARFSPTEYGPGPVRVKVAFVTVVIAFVTLIGQVPLAPTPVVDGTPRFTCAWAAEFAPVPPFATLRGVNNPNVSMPATTEPVRGGFAIIELIPPDAAVHSHPAPVHCKKLLPVQMGAFTANVGDHGPAGAPVTVMPLPAVIPDT
jgi:hypothetical protein